jgi:outer membrane immunogenic protein
MRRFLLSLFAAAFAGDAVAADYLRGSSYEAPSAASYNWAGVYVGGQAGTAESLLAVDPIPRTVMTDPLVRPTIETPDNRTQWPALLRGDARAESYGAFAGYNSQWGDVVIGFELNYNHTSLRPRSTQPTLIVPTTGAPNYGTVDYSAEMRITDYGSARLRAGYAWNCFLPYLFAGLAMGRADLVRTAEVGYVGPAPTTIPASLPYTDIETKNGALTVGYSAGVGLDVGLFPGVFVRGEYEFVQLNTIKGMTAQLNTFRAAAAVKF